MIPSEIRARFAQLDQRKAPLDVPLARWRNLIRDSRDFIDQELAMLALELGWTVPQLWGANRTKPWARTDQQGLLWLVNGSRIDDIGEGYAVLANSTGTRSTFRVHALAGAEICLPWELSPAKGEPK
jgi:hypothetical protein